MTNQTSAFCGEQEDKCSRVTIPDALELSAWRFLAAHRVGGLKVTHVSFIDGDRGPTMNTPSHGGNYESASASTFGEAAVELALALGMPCEQRVSEQPLPLLQQNEDAESSSSASTASRTSGAKSKNSRATRIRKTASTIGATNAEATTGAEQEPLSARGES